MQINGAIDITLDGGGSVRLTFESELEEGTEVVAGLLLPIVELLAPEGEETDPEPGEELDDAEEDESEAEPVRSLEPLTVPQKVERIARPKKVAASGEHRCETCSATYPTSQGLAGHRRSHQTIECEKCGRTVGAAGIGPHRKACKGRSSPEAPSPPRSPEAEPEPVDLEARRRRAAASSIYG